MTRALFLAVVMVFVSGGLLGVASADTCFICTRDSTGDCKDAGYCNPGGPDTGENRKKCQEKGCKIGGTASCPSAANVKVCKAAMGAPELERLEALTAFVNHELLSCPLR